MSLFGNKSKSKQQENEKLKEELAESKQEANKLQSELEYAKKQIAKLEEDASKASTRTDRWRNIDVKNASSIKCLVRADSVKCNITEASYQQSMETADKTEASVSIEAAVGGLSAGAAKERSQKAEMAMAVKKDYSPFMKADFVQVLPGKSKRFAVQGPVCYLSVVPKSGNELLINNWQTMEEFFVFDGTEFKGCASKHEADEFEVKVQDNVYQKAATLEKEAAASRKLVTALELKVHESANEVKEKDEQIAESEKRVSALHARVSELETKMEEDEKEIALLQRRVKQSRAWVLESTILQSSDMGILKNLLKAPLSTALKKNDDDGDAISFRLIYRNSRNGGSVSAFHAACDGKPNTLTICLTNYGHLCGGYTSATWSSPSDQEAERKRDEFAFLFLVRGGFKDSKAKIYKIKEEKKQFAIDCRSKYGPIFGAGHDLVIQRTGFGTSNINVYSRLGATYGSSANYGNELVGGEKYIKRDRCNPHLFECVDYEVFVVS